MDLSFLFSSSEALASFVYASPWGILILFFFTIFANASIFLPIVVEPVVFAAAAFAPNVYVAILIGLITGFGAAIGEMSGYIFGMFGVETLKKMSKKKIETILNMSESLAKKGMLIIFAGSAIPFPFDVIGIAAGAIKYNPKKFFLACCAGKIIKYEVVALAGFFGWLTIKGFLLGG